jgi:hypothetical protein
MFVRASALVFVCAAITSALSFSQPAGARDPNPAMNQPDKYAWQVFIRLNRPAAEGKPDSIWETWISDDDIFPKNPDAEKPPQWPTSVTKPKVLKTSLQLSLTHQLEEKAYAGLRPFAPLQATKEEVRRNKLEYDFIVANKLWYLEGVEQAFKDGRQLAFPIGAIAVKARWKKIDEKDKPSFHWNFDSEGTLVGLVALHISSKVLPNWFWATFEHVDNPERGKDLGCSDSFGVEPPNSCTGKVSEKLEKMMQQAHLGPEWRNYRLNGTQIDFTDSTGRPILLGNSMIEGPQGVMLTSSCMTCHAKALMDGNGNFLPPVKTVKPQPPEGDIGPPNLDWFYNSKQSRKTLQLAFTWGLLNANSIKPPPPKGK